jgi:hypothetical protein
MAFALHLQSKPDAAKTLMLGLSLVDHLKVLSSSQLQSVLEPLACILLLSPCAVCWQGWHTISLLVVAHVQSRVQCAIEEKLYMFSGTRSENVARTK